MAALERITGKDIVALVDANGWLVNRMADSALFEQWWGDHEEEEWGRHFSRAVGAILSDDPDALNEELERLDIIVDSVDVACNEALDEESEEDSDFDDDDDDDEEESGDEREDD